MADVNRSDLPVSVTEQQAVSPDENQAVKANNSGGPSAMQNQKKTPNKKPNNKVTNKAKLTFDALPDGWFKEVKSRFKTPSKKDTTYIELKSGYAFKSMKDVEKYINTGNILSCLSRPQLMNKEQLEALQKPSLASGSGSKPVEPVVDPKLKPGRKKGRKSSKRTLKRKRTTASKEEPSGSKAMDTLSEPGHTENHSVSRRVKPKKEKVWATPVRVSPRLASVKTPITTAEEPSNEIGGAHDSVSDETKAIKEPIDFSIAAPADVSMDVGPIADVATDVGPTTQPESVPKPETKPNPLKEEKTKTVTAEMEEVVVQPPTEDPTMKALFKDQEAGPSMPGGGPGPGDEVTNQKPGSPPLSSFFGDFWQDSCLGYAFKTLTGDMDEIPLDLGLETDKNTSDGPSNGVHIDNEIPKANEGVSEGGKEKEQEPLDKESRDNGVPKE